MRQLARLATRLPAAAPLICAALCLALAAACAQPPTPPQPAPLPASPAPDPSQPTRAAPAHPPRLPATPAPPAAALPPLIAQPTPSPAPMPATPTLAIPTPVPAPPISAPADVAFTQITTGKNHACGLRENGAILCWGHDYGNLDAPAQTDFRQISAGLNFSCALRQNAAIACWGDNSYRQADPPQGSFSEIATGARHACALSQSAPTKLICWGQDFPNGAETLPLNAPISDIQSGPGFTCGLTPQADMACVEMSQRLTEITPGPFTRLGVGLGHVCALRQDGSALCQGDNSQRQANPPTTQFAQISAGWNHSCGITRENRIECWGSGRDGAPGERLAAPDGEFTAISVGWRNSCALRPSGRAFCWWTPDHLTYRLPIGIAEAFGGAKFESPVEILQWQNGGLAIVDRSGLIAAHHDRPNPPPPQTILDISDSVVCCPGEIGMFSAALDPQFDQFPFLYLWYATVADNALGEGTAGIAGRLSRFRVNDGIAVKGSELTILEVSQPGLARLGSALRFGPDDMLYLSLGVGSGKASADAQSLNTLRGKIIRIDVRAATPAQPYRIPPGNPFVDNPRALPEIWAYGLRSPWRMAFDPANPDRLFVADVGESAKEEVSIATAAANLGWPLCEADICQESLDPALAASLAPPAVAYARGAGCAVIGGITVSWLNNNFIFGDYCSRRVWVLEQNGPQNWRMREIADLSGPARVIYSFGAAPDGSVYVLANNSPILRLYPDLVK